MTHFLSAAILCLFLPQEDSTLSHAIERSIADSGVRDAQIAIQIFSTRANRTVFERNASVRSLLASNTKLLTCAAILDRLGPDYKFVTRLHAPAPQEGATAFLVVTGTGDPHISARAFGGNPTALFERWADSLKEKGFTRVDGPIRLVVDKFTGDATPPGWKPYAKNQDRWWAAVPAQFSLNDNCVDVVYRPAGEVGQPAMLDLLPRTDYVSIRNRATTVSGRAKVPFQFTRKPATNRIFFRGDLRKGRKSGTTWVAIHDPQMFFGTVLKETLEMKGIPVSGGVEIIDRKPGELDLLALHETDLATTLPVCLQISHNLYAEMFLLHLGWKVHGEGTRENGRKAVQSFLRKAGATDVSQEDGSGLTRNNLASPESLVNLLRHMRDHRYAKVFHNALAVNGAKIGTLRQRMTGERFAGRVHAKTGHISRVTTLSGYIESESDDTYVFSILVNLNKAGSTRPADGLQDRICELLIQYRGD